MTGAARATPPHDPETGEIIDQVDARAQGKPVETVKQEGPIPGPDAGEAEQIGMSNGKVIMSFLTPAQLADPDWILRNVVVEGKGTHKLLGRVLGVCVAASRQINNHQGKELESFALLGGFELENNANGVILQSDKLFLPNRFGRQIYAALQGAPEGTRIKVDVDIGVEATGKPIPYAWTIAVFTESPLDREMAQLRAARRPQIAARPTPKLIEGSAA